MVDSNKAIRKWSQLNNLRVSVPTAGKTIGTVEDFFFKPDSGSVDALLVRTRLGDALTLPTHLIQNIGNDAVIIVSEQMLTRRRSPYPLGSSIPGTKVQDEKERALGTISEILLNIEPVLALRVAGYEIVGADSRHVRAVTADSMVHYESGLFVLQEQVAKHLR